MIEAHPPGRPANPPVVAISGADPAGVRFEYSDLAIECLLTLRCVNRLTLRPTEGIARSLLGLMQVDPPVPDDTTLCRRPAGPGREPDRDCGGGGAYDRQQVCDALGRRSARAVIIPRHHAKVKRHGNASGPRLDRDENLRRIRQIGRLAWKRGVGLPRALAGGDGDVPDKTIFGDGVARRSPGQQATEAGIRGRALSIKTYQGMPQSERIVASSLGRGWESGRVSHSIPS